METLDAGWEVGGETEGEGAKQLWESMRFSARLPADQSPLFAVGDVWQLEVKMHSGQSLDVSAGMLLCFLPSAEPRSICLGGIVASSRW